MSVLGLASITNPGLEFTFASKTVAVGKALELLKELVWRVYSRIEDVSTLAQNYQLFVDSLKRFLKSQNNSIDIITTNYDLLPEMILYAIKQNPSMPVEFKTMPLPDDHEAPPDCAIVGGGGGRKMYATTERKNLHKLHGSVNWFVKANGNSQEVYCWDELFPSANAPEQLFYTPFAVCKYAAIPQGYLPVIVPPSMIKEYKVPVINKTWQDASSAIGRANKIVFIGYSFPPSDTIMKFFLGTSLANNESGCHVSIIDKNTDTVKESLEEVFVNDIHKYHIDFKSTDFRDLIGSGGFRSEAEFAAYLNS
jgi:hypothetical protein